MNFWLENLRIALVELWANKSRTLLTGLGVAIGIIAVTLMATLINGVDQLFERSMAFLGQDVLYVEKWTWFGKEDWWTMRNRPPIDLKQAEVIKKRFPFALAVATARGRGAKVSYKDETLDGIFVQGVSPNYLEVSNAQVERGRFFTSAENSSRAQVVLLGYEVADKLFPNLNPLGENVFIGSNRFRVIGVLAKMGKFMGTFNMDTQVLIPVDTYAKIFRWRHGMRRIMVKVPADKVAEAREELRGLMRVLRGLKPGEKDNFAVNQQEAFRKQYNLIKMAIGGTGLFITLLSLVVGGIGIANIMFVSVKERTREIGVRMALGARRGVILGQFLLESGVVTLASGLMGLAVAAGLSLLVNKFIFPANMSIGVALFALFLSLGIGLLAGWTPARQAARMNPIEALRYE